jgi:pyridoxine 4-dehydrogenase
VGGGKRARRKDAYRDRPMTADAQTIELDGMRIARVGLGTNRLKNTAGNANFVREAVAAGIRMIDTAHIYTGGESEAAIGAALSSLPDDCVVATKGGYGNGNGRPEVLHAQIEESLRRLRTDAIGLYYLHTPDPDTPLEESVGAIDEHRRRGDIRAVGLSNVSVEQIERARKVVSVAAVQNHYNLSERADEDVIDYCDENGIVFVPYFPLRDTGGGAVREIASRHGVTGSQVVLAWLLRRSPAMLPIPGTLSLEHVRENLAALDLQLSDDEAATLR